MKSALRCLGFLSRIPVPRSVWLDGAPSSLAGALGWAPVVGVVIGILPALALTAGVALGLASLVSGFVAIGCGVLVTGGLHEDGLADVADGFGGGSGRERKLAIMRDSRIGSYGTLALVVAVPLRATLLATVLDARGLGGAVVALVAAAAVSRGTMLLPMALLPPARSDGLAQGVGRLPVLTVVWALVSAGLLLAALLSWGGYGLIGWASTIAAPIAVAVLMTALSRRHIGGVTGDVVGATQQLCEIAALIALSAPMAHG